MSFEFTVGKVRELKGAPLSVLVALSLVAPMGVSGEWLQAHTGYTDKPVRLALLFLQQQGAVVKGAGGWVLAEGKQLPLPNDYPTVIRNYSEVPININRESLIDLDDSFNINSAGRKNSEVAYDDDPEVGQALLDAGVVENWRTAALIGRIGVGDVRRAKERMLAAGVDLRRTGYLIRVLEGMAEQHDRDDQQGGYEQWED